MSLLDLFKAYRAANRSVTASEMQNLLMRLESLESRVSGLPIHSTQDLERQVKHLKTQVENMGLRIGFKAGSGIS